MCSSQSTQLRIWLLLCVIWSGTDGTPRCWNKRKGSWSPRRAFEGAPGWETPPTPARGVPHTMPPSRDTLGLWDCCCKLVKSMFYLTQLHTDSVNFRFSFLLIGMLTICYIFVMTRTAHSMIYCYCLSLIHTSCPPIFIFCILFYFYVLCVYWRNYFF